MTLYNILDTKLSKSKENILPIGENIGNIEQPAIHCCWLQTSMLISAPKSLQRDESQASPFQSGCYMKSNCFNIENYKRNITSSEGVYVGLLQRFHLYLFCKLSFVTIRVFTTFDCWTLVHAGPE